MHPKLHTTFSYIKHLLSSKPGGHRVHSPFVFSLCGEVFYNKANYYAFTELNDLRNQLQNDHTLIPVVDMGAGSRVSKNAERKVSDIARHGISSRRQSEILFRLVNYLKCDNTLELGTSIGLNTLYLAAAHPAGKVTTIEGNPALKNYAADMAKKAGAQNIDFREGPFRDHLKMLREEGRRFDLVYMDGDHRFESTLEYFNELLPMLHENSVVVLDDIYWSEGMTRAWKNLCGRQEVTLSLDLFSMGILFFRKEILEKKHESLLI